jgi:transcriptional regulator with XRE-family HTH domain
MSNPIRAYRKKHRLSQQEVADLLGVARSTLQAWESGQNGITAEVAVKVESILGIDRVLIRPDIFRKNGKSCRFEDTCVHSPLRKE